MLFVYCNETVLYSSGFADVHPALADEPCNGDLHVVVPGKFLAFRGPREAIDHRGSLQPADFHQVFKTLGVHAIVRLNKAEYRKSVCRDLNFRDVQ